MIKKYLFYLFRWQLSTPILSVVLWAMADQGEWVATIIANLIGGLIFFWIDRFIFKTEFFRPLWEIKEDVVCQDCGQTCQGYRLVKTRNYDRIKDKNPEFRCAECSHKKTEQLRSRGVDMDS